MSEILDNVYIWVFLVNIDSVLHLALVRYMMCSHFTQNCIFLYFLDAKNPYFVTKNCSKTFYISVFILSKKRRNWFHKNPHNPGTVGRSKLPSSSLNRIVNVLLMNRLVYNICSHFNELILARSAYFNNNDKSNQKMKIAIKITVVKNWLFLDKVYKIGLYSFILVSLRLHFRWVFKLIMSMLKLFIQSYSLFIIYGLPLERKFKETG